MSTILEIYLSSIAEKKRRRETTKIRENKGAKQQEITCFRGRRRNIERVKRFILAK
jgi:hypothetical protein